MTDEEDAEFVGAQFFWRIHEGLPKQGPGSDLTTRRALASAAPLPDRPKILDLGCGPGRQSLALAEATDGHVTAIDLLPPFLEQLEASAQSRKLTEQIETRHGNMGELPALGLQEAAFDLIWSEGAIYQIGFDEGLRDWRRYLAPGGRVAVTEASWLVANPSERIRKFWQREYAAMRSRVENERAIESAGYRLLDSFVVPEKEWWDDYYTLIEARLDKLRNEREDETWRDLVAAYDEEIAVVRDGLSEFGYVFYVMESQP